MQINTGDCLDWLKSLPSGVVQTFVTSPPYYGLRNYGHDEQIGLEETPEKYVQKLVDVFHEVKRVLKNDGTLWLNLGDSYAGSGKGCNDATGDKWKQSTNKGSRLGKLPIYKTGLKPKDLIGIPWMVAFALRADGWYLRQDIIWNKPNPMPESVTDRCTKSHEYIFLLSKSKKYYYDADAIATDINPATIKRADGSWDMNNVTKSDMYASNGTYNRSAKKFNTETSDKILSGEKTKVNKRSVWAVTTKPFKGAHFATFPEDLIVDCIKAGCPENGIVLDPFAGAFTTGVVAKKLNRIPWLCELNPEYVEIGKKRMLNEFGIFN